MEKWIRLLITPSFQVTKQCLTDAREHWTLHYGPRWVSELKISVSVVWFSYVTVSSITSYLHPIQYKVNVGSFEDAGYDLKKISTQRVQMWAT